MRKFFFLGLIFLHTMGHAFSEFQKLPKTELHLHLGGAYPLDFLLEIASAEQKAALLCNLEQIANGVDYHEVFHVFPLIGEIVNTDEKAEAGMERLCRTLAKDGVVYAEIRTGIKDLGSGIEGYLQAILRGMQKRTSDQFQIRLLLSLKRSSSLELAKTTVDLALKYQKWGIVGIDLSGDSTLGQIETILPELKRAKDAGLFLTVHLGEAPNELSQRQILEELQPHRVGHGVFLTSEAREWIIAHQIPIEVCPTSSVLVGMIDRYEAHPGLAYYLEGHPIIVCTDDPLIFQNSVSSELEVLAKRTSLSRLQLKKIVRGSFEHVFLSQDEKQSLIRRFFYEEKED